MVEDFITQALMEVSPIRSIIPPPFSQKSLCCKEAEHGSLVRMRVDQAISGPSNLAVVVSCCTKEEVVCRAPNTPAITPISSPPCEGIILRSDWVKRRMYGLEKKLGVSYEELNRRWQSYSLPLKLDERDEGYHWDLSKR